jgi:hypothetical protein
MQTIEIKEGVHVSLTKILQGIKKLDANTLDKFAEEVNSLAADKKAKPSQREAELLKKIKTIIPASIKREEKRLYAKMQDGTITQKEHEELLSLLDFMENKAAERIHLMSELAELRGISLQNLAEQLMPKS